MVNINYFFWISNWTEEVKLDELDSIEDRLRKWFMTDAIEYEITGSYDFDKKVHDFSGTLEITEHHVLGKTRDDDSSLDCLLIGTISRQEGLPVIKFAKLPSNGLVPIFYLIMKSDNEEGVSGEYVGSWHHKHRTAFKYIGGGDDVGWGVGSMKERHPETYNTTRIKLKPLA